MITKWDSLARARPCETENEIEREVQTQMVNALLWCNRSPTPTLDKLRLFISPSWGGIRVPSQPRLGQQGAPVMLELGTTVCLLPQKHYIEGTIARLG